MTILSPTHPQSLLHRQDTSDWPGVGQAGERAVAIAIIYNATERRIPKYKRFGFIIQAFIFQRKLQLEAPGHCCNAAKQMKSSMSPSHGPNILQCLSSHWIVVAWNRQAENEQIH